MNSPNWAPLLGPESTILSSSQKMLKGETYVARCYKTIVPKGKNNNSSFVRVNKNSCIYRQINRSKIKLRLLFFYQ